jgi:hypothetical protein
MFLKNTAIFKHKKYKRQIKAILLNPEETLDEMNVRLEKYIRN